MRAAIRRAAPGDEAALALLGAATFLEAYAHMLSGADILAHCAEKHAAARYAAWLADPAWTVLLAEVEETAAPAGYLTLGPVVSPAPEVSADDAEIHRVYVLWRLHGTGLGKRLMTTAFDAAKAHGARRMLVGVSQKNTNAIEFYQRLGFSIVGEREFIVGASHEMDFVLARDLR